MGGAPFRPLTRHACCREMKKIVRYWREEFDWRLQEEKLNATPHFKTTIEGIEVHFLRAKPKNGQKGAYTGSPLGHTKVTAHHMYWVSAMCSNGVCADVFTLMYWYLLTVRHHDRR